MINNWYLGGYLENNKHLTRLVVDESPFVIGRSNTASLTLSVAGVSRQHVELSLEDDRLYVKDLGSVNGTLVNDKSRESWDGNLPSKIIGFGGHGHVQESEKHANEGVPIFPK